MRFFRIHFQDSARRLIRITGRARYALPIKLTDLVAGKRSIAIEFDSGVLNLTYDPSQFTPENERVEAVMNMRAMPMNAIAQTLAKLIVEWDLQDDKGKPVKHDAETLSSNVLGENVLRFIREEIEKDYRPNVMTAGRSGGSGSANGKAPVQVAD